MIRKLLCLAFSGLILPPLAASEPSLIGGWESVERSPGGIGEYIEFRSDGTAYQVSAAMGDATYTLDGEWLLTFWKDRESGKSSALANRVEMEGYDLLQKDEQGNLVSRLQRSGSAARGSAVEGIWCSEDGPGLTTFTEFTAGGDMFIRLPIRVLVGRYWLSGDQLAVELAESTRKEFQFQVTDDVLTVTPAGGASRQFRRARSSVLRKLP